MSGCAELQPSSAQVVAWLLSLTARKRAAFVRLQNLNEDMGNKRYFCSMPVNSMFGAIVRLPVPARLPALGLLLMLR